MCKRITLFLLCLLLLTSLSACGQNEAKSFDSLDDYENATIAVMTGSSYDQITKDLFPDAERKYFTVLTDMVLALQQGKVDGFITDEPYYKAASWEHGDIGFIDDKIKATESAFIFKKGHNTELKAQINEFVGKIKENGQLNYLKNKWIGDYEPSEHPDYHSLEAINGTLTVGVTVDIKPIIYLNGSDVTGYEIELLTMFAKEYGYALEFVQAPFESILPGVSSGKYDLGAGGYTITESRKESVDYSEAHIQMDVYMINKKAKTSLTYDDFKTGDYSIGTIVGSAHNLNIKKEFPEAPIVYLNSVPELLINLKQGKIDCFVGDETYWSGIHWEGETVGRVSQTLGTVQSGFGFAKNDNSQFKKDLDEFIRISQDNGYLDELKEKWLAETEPLDHPDLSALPEEYTEIYLGINSENKPAVYRKNGNPTGMDMELLEAFGHEYGYRFNVSEVPFSSLLAGLEAGKYDIISSGLTITEERLESIDFSEPYLNCGVLIYIDEDVEVDEQSLLDRFLEGFEKTFIREDRYKMIFSGLLTTFFIALMATIFGTLLGFGLYWLSRSEINLISKTTKFICSIYTRIVQGTPVVVVLMILFYVIFGSFKNISGVLVAIFGFTFTFASFVYQHLHVSVGSVDYGQSEAAHALGYKRNKAFFRIILPQAMEIFMPSYCGEVISLVKSTAIVGYIAVNDLTKVSDIIRSNTYEAFFPLISTAIIYFLLTWVISLGLNQVQKIFEPELRSSAQILKGVKQDD